MLLQTLKSKLCVENLNNASMINHIFQCKDKTTLYFECLKWHGVTLIYVTNPNQVISTKDQCLYWEILRVFPWRSNSGLKHSNPFVSCSLYMIYQTSALTQSELFYITRLVYRKNHLVIYSIQEQAKTSELWASAYKSRAGLNMR